MTVHPSSDSQSSDPFSGDAVAGVPRMTTVMPDTGGDTDTLTRPAPREAEPGDHEKFSHYVPKDKILESAMTGEPVRALCGKLWIPNRDPERFPLCPQCKEIYESLSG